MMEWRNPVWNGTGGIECEVKHPEFGWIPFTARADDIEPHGRELFEALKGIAARYVPPPAPSPEEIAAEERAQANRAAAFQAEADPLFFKWQAGEGTEQEWLAKRAEIRERYPYPGSEL